MPPNNSHRTTGSFSLQSGAAWCCGLWRWLLIVLLQTTHAAYAAEPETVHFKGPDGTPRLTAYLFRPESPGPHPAIVAMHGRTGLYSSKSQTYDAQHLAPHKTMWGRFWAERGFVVLFVDTFGPRGYPAGFAAGTIARRPPEINEIRIRPLDAYAGLSYLRTRPDVMKHAVFLLGWSNGGSATLSATARDAFPTPSGEDGFRAAIAVYPACTQVIARYGEAYATDVPLLLLIGSDDREVKPGNCAILAQTAKNNGSTLDFVLYDDAEHGYDTPIPRRQSLPANAFATQDTKRRAESFFRSHLGTSEPISAIPAAQAAMEHGARP